MSSPESMKQSTNLQIETNRKWGMKNDEAEPEPNAMPFHFYQNSMSDV